MIIETAQYSFEESLVRIDQMLNFQLTDENAMPKVPVLSELPSKGGCITYCTVMQIQVNVSSSDNYGVELMIGRWKKDDMQKDEKPELRIYGIIVAIITQQMEEDPPAENDREMEGEKTRQCRNMRDLGKAIEDMGEYLNTIEINEMAEGQVK